MYKVIFLTTWLDTKRIQKFQNFACTRITREVDRFQQFGFFSLEVNPLDFGVMLTKLFGEHNTP